MDAMRDAARPSPVPGAAAPGLLSPSGPAGALGLSSGEAAVMLMDGTARRLWGAWLCPGATPADQAERTRLLAHVLEGRAPADAVVCVESAAWAWLGGPPPPVATVRVRRFHRSMAASDPPLRAVDGLPPERHIGLLHGVRLTTPLRTAVELLGARPERRADAVGSVTRLLRAAGAEEAQEPPAEALEGFGPVVRARIREGWAARLQAFR
jgi:hypothetical protein